MDNVERKLLVNKRSSAAKALIKAGFGRCIAR